MIEGLGQLGEHEFTVVGNFCDDHAGAIAPMVFTDFNASGGHGIVRRGGGHRYPIMTALATQPTIRITGGLLRFIEAIRDIGFRVVLFDPGQNMFGVE